MPTIALIAHDGKKDELVAFSARHKQQLAAVSLIATGTTGQRINEATELPVTRMLSGPLGGDAQIASKVAQGEVAGVVFIVDPLQAHPHDPDIRGLMRVCNVHNIPLATNIASAEMLIDSLIQV